MSAPTPYTRNYDFTTFSTENPNTQQPGAYLDSEFNELAAVILAMQQWNALIQRSDGQLANQSVGLDQLSPDIITGVKTPTNWTGPGHSYSVLDSVIVNNGWYYCKTAHVSSSVFTNDFSAGNWFFMFNVNTGAIDIQEQISNYAAQGVTAPFQTWSLTGDGATLAFTITGATLVQSANYLVSVGGVLQQPNTYTITANTITFSAAPPLTAIWIVCIGYPKAVSGLPVDGGLVTVNTLALNKLVQIPAQTVVGNKTSGTADPAYITMAELAAILPSFIADSGSGGTKGLVPAPTAGQAAAGAFLKANALFEVPPTFVGDAGAGGSVGYVPAPQAGDAVLQKFLSAGGTFQQLPAMTGDAGAGGARGVVPAPAAGDGAAGKYLSAKGLWEIPPNANLPGFRNRAINGDMRLNATKNALTSYSVSTATPIDTLDMWKAVGVASAGVFTVSQQTATPPTGFGFYQRVSVGTADAAPSAGSFYSLTQMLSGYQIADFAFGSGVVNSISLSFQVRSTVTGTFSGALANAAANRSYPFTYSIGTANTWTVVSVVIPGDALGTWPKDGSDSLQIRFDLGSGATMRGSATGWSANNYYGVTSSVNLIANLSATFDITAVQLEKATAATTFEARPVEIDRLIGLARVYCEYNNNSGQVLTANTTDIIFSTKVTDTHNAYNVSTGVFTAPKSGRYKFEAGVGMSAGAKNTLQLYKAGVATYALAINGGTGYSTVCGERNLNLNQGDTVTIRSVEAVTLSASAVNNFLMITSEG